MLTTFRKPSGKWCAGSGGRGRGVSVSCSILVLSHPNPLPAWQRDSHMLSWRTKLAMLLCLKYWGSTSLAKRL